MTAYDNHMFNRCLKLNQQQRRVKIIREYYNRAHERFLKQNPDNSTNMLIGGWEKDEKDKNEKETV